MGFQRNVAPIFVGFDLREVIIFHMLSQTIIQNSTIPVAIVPIALSHLKDGYWREVHPLKSTQFSLSRFLGPYLSQYEGWSIFMDYDETLESYGGYATINMRLCSVSMIIRHQKK
ncbi:hypothetical protein SAMN04488518_1216 [Pseudovibrio ascidiaceicola]|uniref:Uncharacterized protein n=1 Tax=Pseudovibrio ascidiaceicola TaxID=285279 RepID=A0A1I4FNR6_9HYPH|nr:hypothetical protein SAMN04488518_1216 [Pseudovibrio ascidiaceicola]